MHTRSNALHTVITTCLRAAQQMPARQAAELYSGLAEICGDPKEAAQFCKLAEHLADADRECRRVNLDYLP